MFRPLQPLFSLRQIDAAALRVTALMRSDAALVVTASAEISQRAGIAIQEAYRSTDLTALSNSLTAHLHALFLGA